ncbi:MAG: hypothetical protein LBJ73_05250 [Rickettsiales bacterium]|nr:hypothetical protein [Rickettsiales bacterium]
MQNRISALGNGGGRVFGNGARKLNSKLLLMGLSALLGLGNAKGQEPAQTSTPQMEVLASNILSKLDTAAIKESKYLDMSALMSNRALVSEIHNIISSQQWKKLPTHTEFIQNIDGKIPRLNIVDYEIDNAYDLYKLPQGFYLPARDSITIRIYGAARHVSGREALLTLEGKEGNLHQALNAKNDNLPQIIVHELKHLMNRLLFPKIGFSLSDFVELNIHDEITARIAEMLFLRDIYLSSGDMAQAFLGLEKIRECDLLRNDIINMPYQEYVKKRKNLPPVPDEDEINALVNSAIDMMRHRMTQYRKTAAILAEQDAQRGTKAYKSVQLGGNGRGGLGAEIISLDDAIAMIYRFDIYGRTLDFYNDATRAALEKFVQDFKKDKRFKSEFSKVEKRWEWQDIVAKQFGEMFVNATQR